MSEWISYDLSELIVTIESGGRPTGGASGDSGEIPSLGGENIKESGGVDLTDVRRVPRSYFERMSKGILEHGDVLINKDGANTGKVGWYRGELAQAAINEHLFRLRARTGRLTQGYLYYLLLSQAGQAVIRRKISGSAQPGLKSSFINDFQVVVPSSTNEQDAIVNVLSAVEDQTERCEEVLAKLWRVKRGLRQELFRSGIDRLGNRRDETSKESRLGRVPASWTNSTLASVAHRITSGSRGWARYYAETGPIFIRIGNLTRRHVNLRLDDIQHVRLPARSEGKRTEVASGDLLISITADIGMIGVVPANMGEAYVNEHIALVKLDQKKANPWFIGNLLASDGAQRIFANLNDAGAKAGLNLPTIGGFPIVVTERDEQDRIADIFRRLDQQIETQQSKLRKLAHLKVGLMQDLLAGEVSVEPLMRNVKTTLT